MLRSSTKRQNNKGGVVSLVILAISLLFAVFLIVNRQPILDQISVWQYQPSNEIAQIVPKSGMNDGGKFYFYISHPSIESAEEFNKKCSRKETGTAILGCYNGQTIFIYNVTDERLDGIKEVTAAHEMLHAAYSRLGEAEKKSVNELLEKEYEQLKNNKQFAERMAFYDRTEPGERDNELHSIIGTEVASISAELEMYYKKYFEDRLKAVRLHEKYAAVFNSLQKRGEEISAKLTDLAKAIESGSSQYNNDVAQLNQDIAAFNAKASSGGFSSGADFNAERARLIARANQLDIARQTVNDSIAEYNQLREELAAIATESDTLNKSIDSSLAPTPRL